MNRDAMLAWCEDINSKRFCEQMPRWYFVARDRDTGQMSIHSVDGELAQNVRKMGQGWQPASSDEAKRLGWYLRQGQRAAASQEGFGL